MRAKKIILVALGFVFTALGFVGSLLPVLPTTPFLLLAATCFAKGSDRFNHWFRNTALYKKHLESYLEERSMPLKTKIFLTTFATSIMVLSMLLTDSTFVKVFLSGMIIFLYYYFIFRIRTID